MKPQSVHAHEDLVVGRSGRGQVLAQGGIVVGTVDGDGSHWVLLRGSACGFGTLKIL